MDIDFHYRATYFAARAAGYDRDEATTIAHAAQYIDDADSSKLLSHDVLGFHPVPTVQTNEELGWGRVYTSLTDTDLRRVWVPFHFLPGNYKSKLHDDPHSDERLRHFTGGKSDGDGAWKYDSKAEQEFKLMCLPYSPLAVAMINDTVQNYRTDLHMIGVRIHVLIDTFAHMYFAGTPAWHVNSLEEVYRVDSHNQKHKISWGGTSHEWATPDAPSYNSFFYVGHARLGHIPDYPWIKYSYTPKWSDQPILKDNPKEYEQAFIEMVGAMRCIRENRPYAPQSTQRDDHLVHLLELVLPIIRQEHALGRAYDTNTTERSNHWHKPELAALKDMHEKPYGYPPIYHADAWFEAAKKLVRTEPDKNIGNTDCARFHRAAVNHLQFVEQELEKEGFTLLTTSKGHGPPLHFGDHLHLVAATEERKSVTTKSTEFDGRSARKEYFPKYGGKTAATLYFQNTKDSASHSNGEVADLAAVRIVTTEKDVDDYNFLGKFHGNDVYYYKISDKDRQAWKIHRAYPARDGNIVFGEVIYIQNVDNGQYLCPDGEYLSTQIHPFGWHVVKVETPLAAR